MLKVGCAPPEMERAAQDDDECFHSLRNPDPNLALYRPLAVSFAQQQIVAGAGRPVALVADVYQCLSIVSFKPDARQRSSPLRVRVAA